MWFDGAAARHDTGASSCRFSDGTKAVTARAQLGLDPNR